MEHLLDIDDVMFVIADGKCTKSKCAGPEVSAKLLQHNRKIVDDTDEIFNLCCNNGFCPMQSNPKEIKFVSKFFNSVIGQCENVVL